MPSNPRSMLCLLFSFLVFSGSTLAQVVEEEEGTRVETPAGVTATGGQRADISKAVSGILSRTNAFRQEQGLGALEVAPKLRETARYFADFMAREDQYGHHADGQRPAERAKQHGYDYCILSENIAYQFKSAKFTAEELAEATFRGWQESPGHRKNMLDPAVTEIGIALKRSERTGYYYAVQMFGRPSSMDTEFQLSNRSDATIEYEIGDQDFSLPPGYTRTHQGCRLGELIVHWPETKKSATVKPGDGDHYRVARDNKGQLRLEKDGDGSS